MAKDAKDSNSSNDPNNDDSVINGTGPMFEDISNADPDAEDETLKAYREALQQEWAEKNDPSNARESAKMTREEMRKHAPDYLANMRSLAMGAVSESVRYNANKYLLDAVLLPGGAGSKDTMGELLEELNELDKEKAKDTTKQDD